MGMENHRGQWRREPIHTALCQRHLNNAAGGVRFAAALGADQADGLRVREIQRDPLVAGHPDPAVLRGGRGTAEKDIIRLHGALTCRLNIVSNPAPLRGVA
jgi:hypothetical protein